MKGNTQQEKKSRNVWRDDKKTPRETEPWRLSVIQVLVFVSSEQLHDISFCLLLFFLFTVYTLDVVYNTY